MGNVCFGKKKKLTNFKKIQNPNEKAQKMQNGNYICWFYQYPLEKGSKIHCRGVSTFSV